jgi:cytochrome c
MKPSLWFNMMIGAVLATGVGIMGVKLYSQTLYSTDAKASGYPIDAEAGAATAAKGPELAPDWGTLFADPAKLAELTAKGEKSAKVCAACHDLTPAGANKTGPGLAGVMGRAAGSVAGFAYSDGMKALGKSWGYDELDNFLKSPKTYVAGTKMSFAGFGKADDRIATIAYLRSISPSAPALPAPDPARDPAKAAAAAAAPAAEGAAAAATNAVANTVAAPAAAATNAVANTVAAPAAAVTNAVANAVAPAAKH